jgi:hypothetical protein
MTLINEDNMSTNTPFGEALDAFEKMTDEEQEDFLRIIKQRRIERRRKVIARDIAGARKAFASGPAVEGTPQEIMDEIMS